MANLKEIRNRIGSVKSTRKITSAMSRIAAARLRKAQTAMENARQYGARMAAITGEILRELQHEGVVAEHPLLLSPPREKAVAIIVVTADRGLCGGFNSSINRSVEKQVKALWAENRDAYLITIGRKGRDYLKSYNRAGRAKHLAHHPAPQRPEEVVDVAKQAALEAMALFRGNWRAEGDGEDSDIRVGEVRLVFNYFRNVIAQEVHDDRLLPVPIPEPVDLDGDGKPDPARAAVAHAIRAFEPDVKQLLDHLLPIAVETAVQQALYNSVASEVAARRSAMDSATDNATELIGELTLQYNRERQAAITKELMEIIGGAEALKG
jgi:F-type H+-transporting ATPase subunit gamma